MGASLPGQGNNVESALESKSELEVFGNQKRSVRPNGGGQGVNAEGEAEARRCIGWAVSRIANRPPRHLDADPGAEQGPQGPQMCQVLTLP